MEITHFSCGSSWWVWYWLNRMCQRLRKIACFFFFFALWGPLRAENSSTSCPDVNYWGRLRLTNPASRSSTAETTGPLTVVYKQTLGSMTRPPSVRLSTHWSCIKLLSPPTTLKSAVKFQVFSQSRGSHLRCHVDQFIHFQFVSFISFQKVQETACRREEQALLRETALVWREQSSGKLYFNLPWIMWFTKGSTFFFFLKI